jgi:signal transduction histidine kinase
LFNVNRESVIGKQSTTVFNGQCINKKLNKQKYTYETSFRLNNEKIIKCLVTASLFVNYNNETVGVVKTFTDITKLKRIEKKLIKAKKKAEESDKLKSSFLSNMSHELRSPMNSILGFSDLLLDNTLDIKTKDSYLDIIQNAGTDLLKLIDDIIDVAKMEAGQIKLNYESLNLNQMLHEIHIMFNENVNLKMNNVSLNVSIDDSVINDTIFTDGLRLKQVLVNLISNAIKFTHCGSINFGYVKKNNNLEFYIKDTGIGLTKQQINIIWERFRQADDSTTKKYGGTGLGLSISKGLINLLGGEIWVESEYNKGTNFYFSIPYIESAIKDEIINSKNCIYNWSDFTILVAEDVDANYYLLREYLKYTNVKIMRTRNGKETVSVYRKHKKDINLILMDIQMPIMNGTQAMTKIKNINSDVSIIIQSAYAMSEDIKKGFDFGCDDYVTKPILKSELLRKINNLLFK